MIRVRAKSNFFQSIHMKQFFKITISILIFLSVNLSTADTGKIECTTNKQEYELDEYVQIILTNNTASNIQFVNRSKIDGGFATVQIKQANQSWKTIPIIVAANITTFEILKPKESHSYWWHISRLNQEMVPIVSGKYRIVLNIGVQTNEFTIN